MTNASFADTPIDKLTVGTISSGTVLRCAPDTPLQDAIHDMREHHCSSIVITDGNRPIGIWTERDCLSLPVDETDDTAPTNAIDALRQPIAMRMSAPVHSISIHASPEAAVIRMRERRVRHLITVDEEGNLVGIISQSDLIRRHGSNRQLGDGDVGDAIRRTTVFAPGTLPMSELRKRMHEGGCDSAIIHDPAHSATPEQRREYAGIITERDILHNIASGDFHRPCGDLASRPLQTITDTANLGEARDMMLAARLRHLAVIDRDDDIIGVLSFADLLEFIEQDYFAYLRSLTAGRDTELAAARRALYLADKIIDTSPDGIMICAANGTIERVNPAFSRVTGYSPDEVIGKNPRILQSGRQDKNFYNAMWQTIRSRGQWSGEIWNRRKSGEIYPEWLSIIGIRDSDGEVRQYAATFTDISAHKKSREDILRLAHFDELTGYPNRRRFLELLAHGIGDARRSQKRLTILLVDLDNFQRVNNTLGHSDGDDVLVEVARRLHRQLGEDGVLARIGADEFAIMIPDTLSGGDDITLAEAMLSALGAAHHTRKGKEIYLSASIGIASFPGDASDTANLLRSAEIAMTQSKEQGRNRFSMYNRASHSRSGDDLDMESAVRRALDREEFYLLYQPQFCCNSGDLIGVEALLRWDHAERGAIPPSVFIPLAEEMGIIGELGRYVLRRACGQAVEWRKQGLHNLRVAVNVSVQQFYRTVDLADQIRDILVNKGLAADRLEIEVTESLFMQNIEEMRTKLQRIRDLGVRIALDDFGTGFSSLNYLRHLPFDTIKLDRSFVSDIGRGRDGSTLAITILNMAQNLRKKCVAEGVETPEQLALLRNAGCDYVQGYLLGRAMPAEDILHLVQYPPRVLAPYDGSHAIDDAMGNVTGTA